MSNSNPGLGAPFPPLSAFAASSRSARMRKPRRPFRSLLRRQTLVWGLGLLGELALRVLCAFTLSTEQTLVAGPIVCSCVVLSLVVLTVRSVRRAKTASLAGVPPSATSGGGSVSYGPGLEVFSTGRYAAVHEEMLANSYSGGTTVSAGTLLVGSDTSLGTDGVTNDGGLGTATGQHVVNVAGDYRQGPAGTLTLSIGGTTQGSTYDHVAITFRRERIPALGA